ncbi:hypothetical protein [Rhodoferax sp.]|uniref:hypothetical protein n=1 Tax=Rhodoferax sp. TaxID=50421 RepID=UPI00374CFA5B
MPHLPAFFSRTLRSRSLRKAAALLALAAGLGSTAVQAQELYLNGTIGAAVAPGVYGQITFGSNPPPPVLYAQPVVIQRGPEIGPPLYLYVPPGHSKHWGRYCGQYHACGRPVYFVQVNERNRWWDGSRGGPRHDHGGPERHGDDRDHGRGHGKDRGHGHRPSDD